MLLERESEMARVGAALSAADEGRSSLMLLTGPLGIGRSSLLQHLPDLVTGEDVRVLRANAAPMEQDFAFGVVRQLFDSLLAGVPEEVQQRWMEEPDWFARLVFAADDVPTGSGHGAAASAAILHSLRSTLADVSTDTRLLILVDDLQWADVPSLRWLAYLAKRLHGLRAVIVCALRDGDPRAQHPLVREVADSALEVLRPGPLSLDGAKAVIQEQFGEPGDEEYARACHEISAGNPLFLMSVLLGMEVSGYRPTADQADKARSLRPSELRERLASCLRTQPRPVRNLAEAIAAFGDQGEPELIARLAGLDPIGFEAALRALHELGLLESERAPRFQHRVVQDAVESSMTVAERELSHDSAAALLYECGRPAEQVAAQLMAVTSSRRPWSVSVLRSAADTAMRRGAPDIAARYLRRALLDSSAQDEERARLLIDLATAERGFDLAACERHIAQAVPLLTTARDRGAAALRIPPTLLGPAPSSVVELLHQVAEELGEPGTLDGPPREVALRLEARLRHSGHENPAELASAVDRLRALGEEPSLSSGAERELAAVLLNAATLTGSMPAAVVARLADQILEREPATSARVHTVLPLVVIALFAADSVQGISSWLASERRTRRRDTSGVDALVHAEQALVYLSHGRPLQAREHAERAVRLADDDWFEPCTMALAAVAMEARDPGLSEQILSDTGRRSSSSLALTATLQILKASLDAQRGQHAAALDTLLACGRQLEASGWHNSALFPWRPRAIGLYHRLGDSRSALALAEEEHVRANAWGAPAVLGRALRMKGLLHGRPGIAMLREAVTVLRNSANELELARTLELLGRQLGSGPEAEALLREAADLATLCGAQWLAERAQFGLGSAAPPPEPVLTPSERRVVSLVGRGLTNQEIASELGVSSRAVEKHLTNSYRKLHVSGRPELVKALTETGATKVR